MNWYYTLGAKQIKAHRMTILERYQMWKALNRRAKGGKVWWN